MSAKSGSTFAGLTSKQHEVLALVADHRTSKEIAVELGISESAVNQRIEAVRARLGGPPRAKMARDYRLFVADGGLDEACNQIPWQRIQVPNAESGDQMAAAESSSVQVRPNGDGSQLSANFFPNEDLTIEPAPQLSPALNALAMTLIVIAAIASAYYVTTLVGLSG